jgi:hypothetical protein
MQNLKLSKMKEVSHVLYLLLPIRPYLKEGSTIPRKALARREVAFFPFSQLLGDVSVMLAVAIVA